jgi:excisionase family DNA binding protein
MEEKERYSASEAAKVLKLSTRRVRQLAETEEIEGTRDAEGNWRLDKASVHTFRDDRRSSKPREGPRRRSKRSDSSTAWDTEGVELEFCEVRLTSIPRTSP